MHPKNVCIQFHAAMFWHFIQAQSDGTKSEYFISREGATIRGLEIVLKIYKQRDNFEVRISEKYSTIYPLFMPPTRQQRPAKVWINLLNSEL